MLDLALSLLVLKHYTHHAHHIVARVVFNQDHSTLGDIYSQADSDYDDVIERYIGTNSDEALDEAKILSIAAQKVAALPMKGVKENKELLKQTLELIQGINAKIEVLAKDPKTTQGTVQLIGDIANRHEVIIYKLKQRLR